MDWTTDAVAWRLLQGDRYPVGDSPDLRRVAALPRRPPPDLSGPTGAALVELAVARFGLGPKPCNCRAIAPSIGCVYPPWPLQAWALHEMSLVGGVFAPIIVGGGKTLLDVLAAMAVPDCRVAVLLIPPGLREQFKLQYRLAAEHYAVPAVVLDDWVVTQAPGRPVLHVVPYSVFSRPESTDLLERIDPDLVIADEGQKLSGRGTATAARVFRRWAKRPTTRLCTWSGSFARDSVCNFAPLAAFALGMGSPLPLDRAVAEEWGLAVDPIGYPAPPGKLGECLGLPVREGLRRRIAETPGVVCSPSAGGTRVRLLRREPPPVPEAVEAALRVVRKTKTRPDGEELVEELDVARCAQEVSCGFFYRWRYPRGEPEDLIDDWFRARKAWHQELRHRLERRLPHLDSPFLCTRAAARAWGDLHVREVAGDEFVMRDGPTWKALSWPAWRDVRDLVEPEPEAVWVDDWLARDAAAWAAEHRGVVWYRHRAFGERVAELAGLPLHGGGPGAEARILAEDGSRSIVASVKSHGTGRDGLQRLFHEQLLANPLKSGADCEQLLGRLDRPGQRAAEVGTWWYGHTRELREAMAVATAKAEFIRDTLHGPQKLAP